MENKHTHDELMQLQSLPLSVKISMTEYRIREWVKAFGEDGVYVSFSGGKDSTVLLDIVRNRLGYTDIPAVFVDTGLEYPEIREFVKSFDNVVWLKPEMQFKKVIETYGYPFISKEVSEKIMYARMYIERLVREDTDGKIPYAFVIMDMLGINRRNSENNEVRDEHENGKVPIEYIEKMFLPESDAPFKGKALFGNVIHKENGATTNEISKMYDYSRYKWLVTAPFNISSKCCNVMKKQPIHKYARRTGRHPITGQQASESKLRTSQWIQNGCNGFKMKSPISNPMSFWTEQDVLLYIKKYNIPICSVYGNIVYTDDDGLEYTENLFMEDMKLKTTGCSRTGCMFCGYGCHLEKPGDGRFERMKDTHPKQYEWIMKPWSQGGLGYKDVIDWLNENGGLNIRY